MKTLIQDKIENFIPFFNAYINEKNELVLNNSNGDFCMTVDTGFSGGIALSADIIENMNLKLATFDTFTLATGEVTELPVFLSKVIIKEYEIETWVIPGDFLLGIEFLYSAGSILSMNFNNNTVELKK